MATKKKEKKTKQTFQQQIEELKNKTKEAKEYKANPQDAHFFQLTAYIKTKLVAKILFLKQEQEIELPVPCEVIFATESEALTYAPYFLDVISKNIFKGASLVKKSEQGEIMVNEDYVRLSVKPLTLMQIFETGEE